MSISLKAAGLAGILATAAVAAGIPELDAVELDHSMREGEAITTDLGSASAITYWASESDGWHVITTVNASAGDESRSANVVRFSSVLLPGQSQVISVPGAVGEPPRTLRIQRTDDRIEVGAAEIAEAN